MSLRFFLESRGDYYPGQVIRRTLVGEQGDPSCIIFYHDGGCMFKDPLQQLYRNCVVLVLVS